MPRRVIPPTVAAPPPPPPLSPLVKKLRQDWRWAGLSQFIFTFSDAFGLVDWNIVDLEKDLDGPEDVVIPGLIAKLLVALTWNRQINRENAFENLRKQFIKRDPDNSVLGTVEEPIEWAALGLDQKVQILWQLCEWQLAEPARFRSLLATEEDAASWRVDPLGWDKQANTYFLFDDNRLWVQRALPLPPRPPKKSSLKAQKAQKAQRKLNPPKRSHKKREVPPPAPVPEVRGKPLLDADPIVSGTRNRKQAVFYGNVVSTVDALKRGIPTQSPARSDRPRRSLGGATPTASPSKPLPPLPRGTRVSRRLHPAEDDWQQVPKEWMNGKNGDDDSDLSDLTDEEVHDAEVLATLGSPVKEDNDPEEDEKPALEEEAHEAPAEEENDEKEDEEEENNDLPEEEAESEDEDEFQQGLKRAKELPEGFVEWEAVCVTLHEWQHFPEQWAKSKHPDEKALYRVLTDEVAPQIIEVLQAEELERIKQEAINNRKRSSRIAIRELEKAETARREAAEREVEERMERLHQEEERKAREEAEALERERTRDARLREREERIAARKQAILDRAEAEALEREKAERKRERRKRRREGEEIETSEDEAAAATPASNGSAQNSWELKCEVCKQQGWNLKDTADLVCCDDCSRWQHVACHDRQDVANGKSPRDWEKVDFRCSECEMRLEAKRRRIDEGPKAFSSAPVPTAHIALPAHTLAHPVPNPPPAAHPSHAPPYSSASVPDRPRPVLPPPHANGNPTNGPHAQQPYHDQQHAPQLYQAQSSNQPYQNQQQHQPYQPQPQSQQNRPPGANQSGPAPQQTAYSSQPGPVRPPADVPTHSPAQQHHVQASSHVPSATTHVSYPSANQHTPSTASYSAPAPRLHTSVSAAHAPAAIVAPVHSNGQSPVPPPAGEPERPTQ